MKMKSMVLLAVAVACGLVAMLGVQQLVSNGNANAEEEVLFRVLVASGEIAPRTPLDDTNTEFRDLPENAIPEGAVTELAQVEKLGPKSRLFEGDIITLNKLSEDTTAANEIPMGMRVVTVAVNLTKTHSGLMSPGDFVDLQVTYQSRSPEYGLITKSKTFMQNIEVFATDSIRSTESGEAEEVKAKNISLLVTPRDANLLKLAEKLGELHLVLRGRNDTEETDVEDIDIRMLEELTGSVARRDPNADAKDKTEADDVESGDGDVRSFLAGVGDEPEPEPATRQGSTAPATEAEVVAEPVVVRPEHEVWSLEIRAGEEIVTEEILIPIEYPEDAVSPDATPTANGAGTGVLSTLKRVLNAPRTKPTEAPVAPRTPSAEPTLPELTDAQAEQVERATKTIKETLGKDFENGTIPRKLFTP